MEIGVKKKLNLVLFVGRSLGDFELENSNIIWIINAFIESKYEAGIVRKKY